MTKQYKFTDSLKWQDEFTEVLMKGLGYRKITEDEMRTIIWLADCEYKTRGVILDLIKEIVERQEEKQ
ncbi:hypothetical protein [Pseudogracilibacillus auburnensis]|uniref:hypothetical protein n=1 Tax=Pseudogracilibacillus auburnensis TaxID=1494959 RepID=UPI001A969697|nr:hypothetical protein [Pseudogracilibacillus auburnensis]MBO1005768.1 hypothetical protein [Pseudogracilibacillus auburnensis]